jgi:hypothetical protein
MDEPAPIDARAWLVRSLRAGALAPAVGGGRLADLGDGGPPVHVGVLIVVTLAHLSGTDRARWPDAELADGIGVTPDDLRRGRALLDAVAAEQGGTASSGAVR